MVQRQPTNHLTLPDGVCNTCRGLEYYLPTWYPEPTSRYLHTTLMVMDRGEVSPLLQLGKVFTRQVTLGTGKISRLVQLHLPEVRYPVLLLLGVS